MAKSKENEKDIEPVVTVSSVPTGTIVNPPSPEGVFAGSTPPPRPATAGDPLDVDTLKAQLAALQESLKQRDSSIDELKNVLTKQDEFIESLKSKANTGFDPDAKLRFRVELTDAPTWVVEAPHSSLAWAAYCTATGAIHSQHSPSISQVDINTPLGRV